MPGGRKSDTNKHKSSIGSKGALIRAKCSRGENLVDEVFRLVWPEDESEIGWNGDKIEAALDKIKGKFSEIIEIVEDAR